MKKILLPLAIFVLIVFLAIGLSVIFSWNTPYYERQSASTPDNVPQIPEDATSQSLLAALNGKIRGSLSYPGEGIPPMEVCAENITTNEEYCTYEQISGLEFTYKTGYELEVPEGQYRVFTRLAGTENAGTDAEENTGDMSGYKAYYSEFVTCGQNYDCPSHQPVTVKVTRGETVKEINPQDWYAI